ncbi:Crp/Fnr family transcriptional regulator [Roseateles toxinivorans]|uniref:CRP/FNR family transcriptional regulator n=1 Tax=Roseateles toxinivorans TaxID=270368 RepID=A0A4R6QL42_9BURK|nr:Crp/Fnr family transcriptional regulator [Roseateles toxinivorans]TDP64123.1 CRP/FNR family transcriptional regulator [Roseateles toxinivorans]
MYSIVTDTVADAMPGRANGLQDVNIHLPYSLSDLLGLLGAAPHVDSASNGFPLAMRQLRTDAALFHEGEMVECIYFVYSGSLKRVRTAEDGYEQVLGFAGRGDLLGYDGVCMGRHPSSAVALEDARLLAVQTQDLRSLMGSFPAFGPLLQKASSLELQRQGESLGLMAAVSAEVRLARFVLQMSERMQAMGQSARRFHLRMCRRDIASYLGVAHETVSRSFTMLADWGCLQVDNREVEILDAALLQQIASNTRGLLDMALDRARASAVERPQGRVSDSRPARRPRTAGREQIWRAAASLGSVS